MLGLTDKSEDTDETLAFPAVSSPQQGQTTEEAKLRYAVFNDVWQQTHDRVLVSPSIHPPQNLH